MHLGVFSFSFVVFFFPHLPMQLYTNTNGFGKGKEAGKHDGFLCCTLGLGEGSKKTQTCLYWGRDLLSLFFTPDTMRYWLLESWKGADIKFSATQLYNRVCSHVFCSSHSANALCPVDVFLENINELHEPCYDHVSGLQTVLLHNTYVQRTCMVPSEFSLTQKINLFFTALINIPPDHFYLIVACLKALSGLGYKAVHGHNPSKCL